MKKVIGAVILSVICAGAYVGYTTFSTKISLLEKENAELKVKVNTLSALNNELEQEKANSISGRISSAYESAKNWVTDLF